MPVSVKQLRDNQNNFIYPKIAKEGLVEPINSNDVGISAINGIQSSTVQGALNELAGKNVEIVKTVSGSVISVSDSADYRLLGLKLYGKSVQDGAPTPEAPVEIESAGDGGNIATQITGANLFDITKSIYPAPATFSISIESENTFTVTALKEGNGLNFCIRVPIDVPVGTTVSISGQSSDGYQFNLLNRQIDGSLAVGELAGKTMARKEGLRLFAVCNPFGGSTLNVSIGQTVTCTDVTVSIGSTPIPWEPYKSQAITYPTLNGLPGIPVESGGNYTDAEGQQWVCDEVDFGQGKYVQRVEKITLTGDMSWHDNIPWNEASPDVFHYAVQLTNKKVDTQDGANNLLCTTFECKTDRGNSLIDTECIYSNYASLSTYAFLNKSRASTPDLEGFKGWIDQNQPVIYYILQTPIETDLTPEQLEAYAALTTYKPNTTITTDSDPAAGVEVKYLTDSGVSEVLDYYASKDDLADKQDKLSGTAGQFVGFDTEGEAEAQEITAADVGAMAAVDGGTTGQYLRKTADGQAWQDGPDLSGYATTADVAETYAKKALKFTGTFTAAGWTSATGGYSQMINVSGLTADDEPIIDLNSTATDADTFDGQLEAFGLVSNFTTGAGTLTAVVLGDSAPTVDIPIHGVVVY